MSRARTGSGWRRPDGWLLPALGLGYVLGAVALAGTLAWSVYGTWRLALVTGVGAAVGAAVAVVGARRRWSGWTCALASLVGYLVAAVPVAVPFRLGSARGLLSGELEAVAGPVVGWKQVLTLGLPVQDYRATLVPWFAAVVVTATVGAVLALRGDARAPLAVPTMGVLVALAGALGPVEPGAAAHLGPLAVPDARVTAPVVAFVAVSVLWLGLRSRALRARAVALATATTSGAQRHARAGWGAAWLGVTGAALGVVALAAGALVSPLAQAADRRSLRAEVDPVRAVQAAASPLDRYRASFARDAADELFRVQVRGADVERLRLAVLDDYDGQHFTTSTGAPGRRFARVPRSSSPSASTVTVQVGRGFSGIWVPLPQGAATAPRFAGPRADRLAATYYASSWASAAVVTTAGPDGARGLLAGDSYSVLAGAQETGVLGAPAQDPLLDADRYPQLVAWVKKQGQPRDADGLEQLVLRLRARGYLSHWLSASEAPDGVQAVPAYAGHSTARVESLFRSLNEQQAAVGDDAGDAALVAAVGDDEQFATAAALLARYLGFDSRVVLGVRLHDADDPSLPTCDDGVCGPSALAAWVEVRSPAGSWATLDADPQTAAPPRPVTQGRELPNEPTHVEQPAPAVVEPRGAAQDTAHSTPQNASHEHAAPASRWERVARAVGLGLAAVIVLLAPLLTVPVAKTVRRRGRRRARVPEVAVVGAWAELADRCLDLGAPLEGPTRRAASAGAGRPTAVALAELVDEAVYAPVPPGAVLVDEAWRLIEADLADLAQVHSPWARVVAALRPRSLFRAVSPPGSGRPDRHSSKEQHR